MELSTDVLLFWPLFSLALVFFLIFNICVRLKYCPTIRIPFFTSFRRMALLFLKATLKSPYYTFWLIPSSLRQLSCTPALSGSRHPEGWFAKTCEFLQICPPTEKINLFTRGIHGIGGWGTLRSPNYPRGHALPKTSMFQSELRSSSAILGLPLRYEKLKRIQTKDFPTCGENSSSKGLVGPEKRTYDQFSVIFFRLYVARTDNHVSHGLILNSV